MVKSDLPIGIDSSVRSEKNIETLIGYLSDRHYLLFNRLQEMLNDIFAVQISEKGLYWLLNLLASKGADAYEMIWQGALHSRVIGTDETSVKFNGKKHWFWTWQNKGVTFIATFTNR